MAQSSLCGSSELRRGGALIAAEKTKRHDLLTTHGIYTFLVAGALLGRLTHSAWQKSGWKASLVRVVSPMLVTRQLLNVYASSCESYTLWACFCTARPRLEDDFFSPFCSATLATPTRATTSSVS